MFSFPWIVSWARALTLQRKAALQSSQHPKSMVMLSPVRASVSVLKLSHHSSHQINTVYLEGDIEFCTTKRCYTTTCKIVLMGVDRQAIPTAWVRFSSRRGFLGSFLHVAAAEQLSPSKPCCFFQSSGGYSLLGRRRDHGVLIPSACPP